ncbi:hypothetical protein DFA_07650 [Cavenderia fasciculata]|uniref:Uncharacterized protein n=1 Tax=Cavenderia fasciculata TaxID=261658 RepID=F4Q2J3_CACFS|nr:uncharacterized protein DFA_07650 [Cavenderia fasciculata]EGG16672.1 hypothetical protein DFA_07650 [Cavenderia fasciculata]|eukprot:XP_004355146.1 hypothetical protein DFA_07650 [Cavenderia fasciculata]
MCTLLLTSTACDSITRREVVRYILYSRAEERRGEEAEWVLGGWSSWLDSWLVYRDFVHSFTTVIYLVIYHYTNIGMTRLYK